MLNRLIPSLLMATALLSYSSLVSAKDVPSTKPAISTEFNKTYRCPPFSNAAQCKKEVKDNFIECMKRIDQEDEDTQLDSKVPSELTQRFCETEREKHLKECDESCK